MRICRLKSVCRLRSPSPPKQTGTRPPTAASSSSPPGANLPATAPPKRSLPSSRALLTAPSPTSRIVNPPATAPRSTATTPPTAAASPASPATPAAPSPPPMPSSTPARRPVWEWPASAPSAPAHRHRAFDIRAATFFSSPLPAPGAGPPIEQSCVLDQESSSGHDPAPSFFLSAGSDGRDVFFGTHSRLVPQDGDSAGDVYDARICTESDPCVKPPAGETAQCEGGACQTPPPPPIDPTPGSLTFSGAGNLVSELASPPAPTKKTIKCSKGKKLSHGKCVKCSKGKKLSHGKCLKSKSGKKAKATKAGGDRRAKR